MARKKLTPVERLKAIEEIIEDVDNRAMVCDGDVPKTKDEMTHAEVRRIYLLASNQVGITCGKCKNEYNCCILRTPRCPECKATKNQKKELA
jgi:hypothetical protein